MSDDNCDTCNKDYDFRVVTDRISVYPDFPHYNHVNAQCPHCSTRTIIFCDTDTLVHHAKKLTVSLYEAVHASVARSRDIVDARAAKQSEPEPLWLSPRTERYINYFRDQLERGIQE